jgi:hypothetical protein
MLTYDQFILILIVYASGIFGWTFWMALRGHNFDIESIISAIIWPLMLTNLIGIICRHFIKKIF